MLELLHELRNDLRLGISENLKEIPEMLGCVGGYTASHPRDNFSICAKKLRNKHVPTEEKILKRV